MKTLIDKNYFCDVRYTVEEVYKTQIVIPDGWESIGFRKPLKDEWFLPLGHPDTPVGPSLADGVRYPLLPRIIVRKMKRRRWVIEEKSDGYDMMIEINKSPRHHIKVTGEMREEEF
jgi:hypothetical protein